MFETAVRSSIAVITPAVEELNPEHAPELYRAVARVLHDSSRDALVDLARVEFMTSPVIGALVKVKDEFRAANRALGLCRLTPVVEYVFKRMHLDLRFPIFGTLEEALTHLRPPAASGEASGAIITLCGKTRCLHHRPGRGEMQLCVHPQREMIEDTRRCGLFVDAQAGASAPVASVIAPSAEPRRGDARIRQAPAPAALQAPASPAPPPAAPSSPKDAPSPLAVVRQFIESLNRRDWRAAYDAMKPSFAGVSYDEYRLAREAYYKKMASSGKPPEQYLLRVETSEVVEQRALLRCVRLDVSGWGRREYPQDYALELIDGQWKIASIFTGGRGGRDRRGEQARDTQDRRMERPATG